MKETNRVGVDTHKETLSCYKDVEFKTNEKGFEAAIRWVGNNFK